MRTWMVPKPSRLPGSSGFAQRIAARHTKQTQQVSAEEPLTYLLMAQAERADLDSLVSCMELLARLLAQSKQVPGFVIHQLFYQVRWQLSSQMGLSSQQYQSLSACYRQLIQQHQAPQAFFSDREVLQSLSELRKEALAPADSASERNRGMTTQSISDTVVQSVNIHLYRLLRKYPKLFQKESNAMVLFMARNTGKLERLIQSRFSWRAALSQLSEQDASWLLQQLVQQDFFQASGAMPEKAGEESAKYTVLQWVNGASLKQLRRWEQWVSTQSSHSSVYHWGSATQEQEVFFSKATDGEMEEYLEQRIQSGDIPPALREDFRLQMQQLRQSNQRLDQLEQRSTHLWQSIQQRFASEFFSQSQGVQQQWLARSMEHREFEVDFLGYAVSTYVLEAGREELLGLARQLEKDSPMVARWLSLWTQGEPSALQAFQVQQSQQWNQTFQQWGELAAFRDWQAQVLPEIEHTVWENQESQAFATLRGEVFRVLQNKEVETPQVLAVEELELWLEQGIWLEGMRQDAPGHALRETIWHQHQMGRETILPVLRERSFAPLVPLQQQLDQAESTWLQTASTYLITQVQDNLEWYTQAEIQWVTSLEQILCTAPGSRSLHQHQLWQKQEMITQLKTMVEHSSALAEVLTPLLDQKQEGNAALLPGYLEQLSVQDVPRMHTLLQATAYVPGFETLREESRELMQEYQLELTAYLRTTSSTASLVRPAWDAVAPMGRESLFRVLLSNALVATVQPQPGLLVSAFLEELVAHTQSPAPSRWDRIVEEQPTLVFLHQYLQQTQQGEEYQPVLTKLGTLMERLDREWKVVRKTGTREEQLQWQLSQVAKEFQSQVQELYQTTQSKTLLQALERQLLAIGQGYTEKERQELWEHSTILDNLRTYAQEHQQQELYHRLETYVQHSLGREVTDQELISDESVQTLVEKYQESRTDHMMAQLTEELLHIRQGHTQEERRELWEHSAVLDKLRTYAQEHQQEELYHRVATRVQHSLVDQSQQVLALDEDVQTLMRNYQQGQSSIVMARLAEELHRIREGHTQEERQALWEHSVVLEELRTFAQEHHQQELYEQLMAYTHQHVVGRLTSDTRVQAMMQAYQEDGTKYILERMEEEFIHIREGRTEEERRELWEHSNVLEHLRRYAQESRQQELYHQVARDVSCILKEPTVQSITADARVRALVEGYQEDRTSRIFARLEAEVNHIREGRTEEERQMLWEHSPALEHLRRYAQESRQPELYDRLVSHVERSLAGTTIQAVVEDEGVQSLIRSYASAHQTTLLSQLEEWRRSREAVPEHEPGMSQMERSLVLNYLRREPAGRPEAHASRTTVETHRIWESIQQAEYHARPYSAWGPLLEQWQGRAATVLHRGGPRWEVRQAGAEAVSAQGGAVPMLTLAPGKTGETSLVTETVVQRNVQVVLPQQVLQRFRLAGQTYTNETYFMDSEGMQIILTNGSPSGGSGNSFQYHYAGPAGQNSEAAQQQEERLAKLQQQLTAYGRQLESMEKKQAKLAAEALRKADRLLMEESVLRRMGEDIRMAAKRHGYG